MEHHFNPEIATTYGVNVAIFLHNIAFWVQKNIANEKHFHDGRYWTYNSVESYTMLFPYWSEKQIRTVINNSIKSGLILKGNYNNVQYDRTCWYALTDKAHKLLNIPILPNGQMEVTKRANGSDQKGEPIPYINTDIKTDIKPDKNIPEFLNKDLWERFKKHRTKIKKPMTDEAIVLLLNKIIRFHNKGYNINELLELSIECGWPSIYEPRKDFKKSNEMEIIRPKYRDFTQERLDREAKQQ